MQRVSVFLLAAVLTCPAFAYAQAGTATNSVEPFKVGTFSSGAAPWVGIVLRDRFVVDLAQANAAMEKSRSYPARGRCRPTWSALIADYENGLKGRIYAIVNDLVQSNALTGTRPPYVREVTQVQDAGADPAAADDHEHGGQLLQPHRGGRAAGTARAGRSRRARRIAASPTCSSRRRRP